MPGKKLRTNVFQSTILFKDVIVLFYWKLASPQTSKFNSKRTNSIS